jgi:sulfoxide reductase heme-binding subunit YedZ
MLPLAITSTAGWIRRLGGKNWQRLHRLIYVAAVCGVVHYWWLVKSDIQRPLIYALIFSFLLGYRIVAAVRRRAPRPAVASGSSADLLRRPS